MEWKRFKYLLQNYRTFTEFKGDLVTYTFCHLFPNISALLGIFQCISLFFPSVYFSLAILVYLQQILENVWKQKISWKWKLLDSWYWLQVRLVLLHELENRSISWKRIEWNNKNWNLDRIVLELKAKGYCLFKDWN